MIVNNLKEASCVIDLSKITMDKANSAEYNCFLVNKDKEFRICRDGLDEGFSVTIYKPWTQMDRIGGDS